MHAEESEQRKRLDGPVRTCRRACVPDTILTAVALVLATGGSYFIDWAEYTGGLRSLGVGRSFPLVLGMRPVIIVITLVVALRWLLARSLVLSQRLLRFSFPAICLVATLLPIKASEPMAAIYLRGFEQRMLKAVDVGAVQQWLTAEGRKHAGRVYRPDFPLELPTCLTEFRPSDILFGDVASERGITIEFRWYAPHGEDYGLVIGPPSMTDSFENMIRLPDSGLNEFRRPIKPGVYVFARG